MSCEHLLEVEAARVDAPGASAQNMKASSGSALWPSADQQGARHGSSGDTLTAGDARRPLLSDAIQDYLKEIYKLGSRAASRVSMTALARAQQVSAASASAMVKKLAALGLAEHAPYRGVHAHPPASGSRSR